MKKENGILKSKKQTKVDIPLKEGEKTVQESKYTIESILSGKSTKKILIIGPCSADFEESLYEYAEFIAELRKKYSDKIEIIMRFYTGKPRTVGGWKGLQNSQPGEKPDVVTNMEFIRKVAIHIIQKYKVPLADEMLHNSLANHFEDIYSYLAVGARSTENQGHREVGSGLNIPIGFKNPTSGDITTMINSIKAAQTKSDYHIWDQAYKSTGNEFAHGILRGGNIPNYNMLSDEEKKIVQNIYQANEKGVFPNYGIKYIQKAYDLMQSGVQNPGIIIDCNHDNSGKKPEKQIEIVRQVLKDIKGKKNLENFVKGFMVESYLYDERQEYDSDESKIIKGKSLTDPCIGKEGTLDLVKELYNSL